MGNKYYTATILDKLPKECFENNVVHRMLNTMENKYYIPSIEEFHVGFEYYVDDKLYIITDVVLKLMLNAITEDTFEGKYGQGTLRLNIDNVRVKYLDREDIESLGWTVHGYMSNENIFTIEKDHITYTLILYPNFNNKIEIRCSHPSIHYGNFLGYCKNKSELKRVLKQVGVL